jgi:hypothetical protein
MSCSHLNYTETLDSTKCTDCGLELTPSEKYKTIGLALLDDSKLDDEVCDLTLEYIIEVTEKLQKTTPGPLLDILLKVSKELNDLDVCIQKS